MTTRNAHLNALGGIGAWAVTCAAVAAVTDPPARWVAQDRRTGVVLYGETPDGVATYEVSSEAQNMGPFQAGIYASLDIDGAFAEGWSGHVSSLRDSGFAAAGTASGRARVERADHSSIGGGYSTFDAAFEVSQRVEFSLVGVAIVTDAENCHVAVRLIGDASQPIAHHLHIGRDGEFALSGVLSPGMYRVHIEARTAASSHPDADDTVSTAAFHAVLDLFPLRPACPCDWNHDGRLDSADHFAFLDDFFAGKGDFDGDGITTSTDYFLFLDCVAAGCE